MGAFILAFWRETLILTLVAFIFLADAFYVDKIKLERDLAQAKYNTVSHVLENQSNQILENSEATRRIVTEEMENLQNRLDALTEEQRQQIEDLLKVEIPEDSLEDLIDFLIDLAEGDLRWSND